ncbi:MAG: helix-turn-helix domain-containing protein [bacterium]|jgi:y4mF family transcriptional regulator
MNAKKLGALVRMRRRELKLNQSELALVAGTGRRFVSDLENGKGSCELEKSLLVLSALGIALVGDWRGKEDKI